MRMVGFIDMGIFSDYLSEVPSSELTSSDLWCTWKNLSDSDICEIVLPHIEKQMTRAKEQHEFYAYTFFRFWRNAAMQKIGAAN